MMESWKIGFDWTISLGNVITTAFTVGAILLGAWKYLYNHIEHLSTTMKETAAEVRADLLRQRKQDYEFLNVRLSYIEAQIAELRVHLLSKP